MDNQRGRKLFTAGELLTLAGVVLVVMSSANTWANLPPKTNSMVAATYVATYQRDAYLTAGYGLYVGSVNVGWAVVLAALAAGSLLLFKPAPSQRRVFFVGQLAAALVVLFCAVRYISLYPGVIMALAGAAALLGGAFALYGRNQAR